MQLEENAFLKFQNPYGYPELGAGSDTFPETQNSQGVQASMNMRPRPNLSLKDLDTGLSSSWPQANVQ